MEGGVEVRKCEGDDDDGVGCIIKRKDGREQYEVEGELGYG